MVPVIAIVLATALASPVAGQVAADPAASSAHERFIAPATIDNDLEITGQDVAARQLSSRMSVGVTVNGQGPFRFIVDSGADRSVIGDALATRLGLPREDPITMHSMTGTAKVGTVRLDNLQVGGSISESVIAPALPEAFIGAQGLIGIDALAMQRMTMDFEKNTITVEDTHKGRREAAPASDEIIVTARRRKGQLILTAVTVGREKLSAVIDTGAEVTIGNSALRARLMEGLAPLPVEQISLVGVTGDRIIAEMVVVPEMRIGDLRLQNVAIAFADVPPFALFGLGKDPALLLGTDVLQTFRRVSLDFRNRKVGFRLRA